MHFLCKESVSNSYSHYVSICPANALVPLSYRSLAVPKLTKVLVKFIHHLTSFKYHAVRCAKADYDQSSAPWNLENNTLTHPPCNMCLFFRDLVILCMVIYRIIMHPCVILDSDWPTKA